MRSQEPRRKLRATAGRAIAVCVMGACALFAPWMRLQRLGADETQATAAPSTESFRGRLITDWVAELRRGPVDELVAAGPEALIVWEQAARDAGAVTWVDHCLQVHFRDAPWVARVYVAMLDSPQFIHRKFALLHLQSNPTARHEAAPLVLRKAREWAQNGDEEDRRLIDDALRLLAECKPAPEGSADLVRELWPSGPGQVFDRWDLLSMLSSLGRSGVDTFIDLCRDKGAADMDVAHFMLHANAETIQGLMEASRSEDTVRRRLAALLMTRATTGSNCAEHHKLLVARVCELLQDNDAEVRAYALDTVRDLVDEPEARAAIPDIAQEMSSPERRWAAAQTLARFGDSALASIRQAAHSDDPGTRAAACLALRTMKPFPKDDVGLLLVLTDDPQPEVRRHAVYALGSSHLEDPAIVMRLVKALQDPQTRDWATRALGNLGPAARGAVAELEAALQADDLRVRLQAAEALWAVSQDVDKVLPVVSAIVEHDQGITVGGYSATTQIVDGKRVEQHHPYRTPLAQRAVELLGKMGPAAKPAAGMLESLLTHPDQSMQRAASQSLARVAPLADDGLPRVVTFSQPAERPARPAGRTRRGEPSPGGTKTDAPRDERSTAKVSEDDEQVTIVTPELEAAVRKKGYVSGVAAGSFLDRKTGYRDPGFGLDIVDWIMEPGSDEAYRDALDRQLVYEFNTPYHGATPKRSLEGPQICTQAKEVAPEVIRGKDFVAVRMSFTYTLAAPGKATGSQWTQTIVFPQGARYVISSDRIDAVNSSDAMFLRIDMPGHVKHNQGDSFSEIYLSYLAQTNQPIEDATTIPSSAFLEDFAPDARFHYRRDKSRQPPDRFIRAVRLRDPATGEPGPWLAGMTLDPAIVHEAWCHQRGYVCMIEEFGGRPIQAGESFSGAFVVGYFDSIDEMHKVYDQYKGCTGLTVDEQRWELTR